MPSLSRLFYHVIEVKSRKTSSSVPKVALLLAAVRPTAALAHGSSSPSRLTDDHVKVGPIKLDTMNFGSMKNQPKHFLNRKFVPVGTIPSNQTPFLFLSDKCELTRIVTSLKIAFAKNIL